MEEAAKADEVVLHIQDDELARLIWDRLGLRYQYQRFGVSNAVERLFGCLKQRTRRYYNNINTWKIKTTQQP